MTERPSTSRSDEGFALIGTLVLVALLVIISVGAGGLYLRQLDQQRQVQTQKSLETAFHGLFPGNQRPGANMWKDFGFTPDIPATPPGGYDLRCMTTRAQVGNVDFSLTNIAAYTGTPNPALGGSLGAWNGSYWQGSVDSLNRPVDAWGKPILLRYINTTTPPGWQVFSPGANGAVETGNVGTPVNDDQVYPQPPYAIPSSTIPIVLPTNFLEVNWVDIHGAEQIRVLVENLVNGVWVTVLYEDAYAINKNRDYNAPQTIITSGQVRISVYRKPGGTWVMVTGFPKLFTVPPLISEVINLS